MKRFLSNSIAVKVLALVVLMFLAKVPLAMIESIINERGAMKQVAASNLADSYAHAQTLAGPVIVVPYTERWIELKRNDDGVVIDRLTRSSSHIRLVYPERLRLQGELAPDKRYRGIYTVLFYSLKANVDGRFPAFDPSTIHGEVEGATLEIGTPLLALGMGDVRGLQGSPRLLLAGEASSFQPRVPGMNEDVWPFQGVHAQLPAAALDAWKKHQTMDFHVELALTGQSRFGIVPLADDTRAHVTSTWPHPSFGGSFLATQRTVSDAGFEADWAVASVATSARAQLDRYIANAKPGGLQGIDAFDVSLIDPLDVYALTGRAVKYGLLFVALTLMAAFMFELLRNLRLHPVQYGLVGLAISLFFLLLLALSEKIDFAIAYLVATSACVLLLAVYFSAVLGHWRRGIGLGAYVAVLYAALYGLLLSEDNALLLGAVLLFGMLSMLMIATRKVDWYALSAAPSAAAGQ